MKKVIIISIALLMCWIASSVSAQTPLRQVIYTVNISKIFAVPLNVNIQEQLTAYDYTRMIWQERQETTHMVIDQDNKLTITRLFPQSPRFENDFEFNTGMSISNELGTMLYNHEFELLDSIQYPDLLEDFSIEPEFIDVFPSISPFQQDIYKMAAVYEEMGFTVAISEDEQRLSAINDSLEYYLDYSKLISENRFFIDSILVFSDWQKYQIIDEYTIPMINVYTTYEYLVNNIRMQVSEVTRYTRYQLVNNLGDTLVSFLLDVPVSQRKEQIEIARFNELKKQNHILKAFPNPANDIVHLEIPLFAGNVIECEILNVQGKAVYSDSKVNAGQSFSVGISHLKPGIYLVKCGKGSQWKTTRFIKN